MPWQPGSSTAPGQPVRAVVTMLTVVLIVAGVFLALGGTTIFLVCRLSSARAELFGLNRDADRLLRRHTDSKKAARVAEERCRDLARQVDTLMTSAGQALNVARGVDGVRRELRELTAYIGEIAGGSYPAAAEPARHALPVAPQRALPVSHIHVDHQNSSPVSIANGTTQYVRGGN